ncbi:hypothetical protein [Polaribacter aestuariivivens]|uniref:hypothetical protein n=1 Tax=Polaribacter aestuariivivens TaxID=2304626 RepID=UPI003F493A31
MKSKIYLSAILFFLAFTVTAQEKNIEKSESEKKFWEVFYMKDFDNQSQFITDFMQSKLNIYEINKVLDKQSNSINDNYNDTERFSSKFSKSPKKIIRIFHDNVEVLGDGINRVYTLEQLRVRDFEKVALDTRSSDKKIYLYSKI